MSGTDRSEGDGLFNAMQHLAEHCECNEVACAAISLASSALCNSSATLVEAEIKAGVLGKMLVENLRKNWTEARK